MEDVVTGQLKTRTDWTRKGGVGEEQETNAQWRNRSPSETSREGPRAEKYKRKRRRDHLPRWCMRTLAY